MAKKEINTKNREWIASFTLRAGLASVLFYASISALIEPISWKYYIPTFVGQIVGVGIFLKFHSISNFILGLWLLSGKKIFYPAILTAFFMLLIIVFNLDLLDIIFRDIAIMFSAIALAVLHYKKSN